MPFNEIAGYRLIKLIGSNGSEVWLAEKNGKQYAIKFLKKNLFKTLLKRKYYCPNCYFKYEHFPSILFILGVALWFGGPIVGAPAIGEILFLLGVVLLLAPLFLSTE